MDRKVGKLPYRWDDERGVVSTERNRQAIQLLLGPATRPFRERCGKLLVAALNAEEKQGKR